MSAKTVNIINVPSDVGSVFAGKSKAPTAFKSAGLHQKLQDAGFRITESTAFAAEAGWASSSREPNGARNEARTVAACHKVKQAVAASLAHDNAFDTFQLMLSGECLYCPAILSAYWDALEGSGKRVGIIYMDADSDLYTPGDRNAAGTIAGMTLTHLLLRDGSLDSMKAFSRPGGAGVVDSSNIALFGLNIDSPANKREHLGYLFDGGFKAVTSRALQDAPVKRAQAVLSWMENQVDYILVHLDVDVIDPGLYPLGNVPSYTGLGFGETLAAAKTFLESNKVVGLSVAEVNPDHDPRLEMIGQLVDELVEGLSRKWIA